MAQSNQPISAVSESLVSIIIPSLNPNWLLFETLNCIKSQTHKNIEVVFVDDGSTKQDSLDIIALAKQRFPDMKVQRHAENKGLPAARNTGVRASTGKYVFFLDGDDLIDATAIEKHYLTLEHNPSFDFVNSFVVGFGSQSYEWRGGFHDKEAFLKENRNTSCFMTRRSLFEEMVFDEALKHGCEDWDFWLNAASRGLWGYTIPEFLFYYRRSNSAERWEVLSSAENLEGFASRLRSKYLPILEAKGFPTKEFQPFRYLKPEVKSFLGSRGPKEKEVRKILFLFPWLEIGGADKFNLDLLKGLKDKGWEITIACTLKSSHPWLKEFQKITSDIFLLSNYSSQDRYYDTVSHLIGSREIQQVFISNSLYGYYLTPFIKKTFPDISIVDCIHCEDTGWLNGGYPRISNTFSDYLDQTYVSTRHLKNYILQLRGNRKDAPPVEVCYTNIDVSKVKKDHARRDKLRSELGIKEYTTVILFSARMVEQKQPLVLAEAIKRLLVKTDNFICIALGDGPLLPALKKYINENNLQDRIWCLGAVQHEEHLKYMDAADVFFLPSSNEGIAITLYESMAKELVVVGAAVGGQKELIDDSCGYLIKNSNPSNEAKEYAGILARLVNDESTRNKLKQAARKKIESGFDLKQMHDQMDSSLKKVYKANGRKDHLSLEEHYLFMLSQFLNEESKTNLLWNDLVYLKGQNINMSAHHTSQGKTTNGVSSSVQMVNGSPSNSTIVEELEWFKQEHIKLKEWYTNQYEVLPLWYKRVGHILKVFKGKRKVKSLFKE